MSILTDAERKKLSARLTAEEVTDIDQRDGIGSKKRRKLLAAAVVKKVESQRDDLYAQADMAQAELREWKEKYRELEAQLPTPLQAAASPRWWRGGNSKSPMVPLMAT